jgi:multicomponent K+:H+ antiporter subunit D
VSHLVILPLLIPLIAGAILVLPLRRAPAVDRTVALAAVGALAAVSFWLLAETAAGRLLVYYVGDWPAPYGITLVADRLSALMLCLAAILGLGSLLYAVGGDDLRGGHFHGLFQMQLLGINGAFLTGDLFNLFVFFEILLIASYALQLHGGGAARVRAALHLVVLNLVGSAMFLIGIALIYSATGTLNLADLAVRIAGAGTEEAGLLRAGGLLLLVVFALKAALTPLGFWLPPAYGVAAPPVAALFAIMTKVGAYAILRVHGLIYGPDAGPAAALAMPWLVPVGLATVVVATLGVLASRDLQRLLSHLVVLSAGTLITALGLGSAAAVSAALFYAVNSTLVGGGLFLVAGLVSGERGDAGGALDQARSVLRPALLGSMFFIGAIAAAGLPPLAGFAAKLYILQSALEHPTSVWVLAVILLSSLFVIVSLSRAGSAIFWRTGDAPAAAEGRASPLPAVSAALLTSATLVLMLGARPLTAFTQSAADQLADRDDYVQAVLANRGVSIPATQRGEP